MNISLSAAGKKGKKKRGGGSGATSGTTTTSYGLNVRGKKSTNVFGDDDDDDDSEDAQDSQADARAVVNQALRKEQEALRQRAEKELAQQASQQQDIYDYDGAYESFHSTGTTTTSQKKDDDDRKSRYIGNLLKTAQERKLDRDIAYERKVAREQKQEEEENVELRGKAKFVTASYKRKLEERKLWKDEQDKIAKLEQDVTQKEGGMANFYGNLSQNVAMGGGGESAEEQTSRPADSDPQPTQPASGEPKAARLSFLEGFTKTEEEEDKDDAQAEGSPGLPVPRENTTIDPEVERQQRRRQREEKVAQARLRYLERHGIEAITES